MTFMAERLKNVLSFANLAPGASITIPHGLNTGATGMRPLAPDMIYLPSPDLDVASDTINVTLTNLGAEPLSGSVLVEAWHTIERAFADVNDEDLPVKPYIVVSVESGNAPPQPPFNINQVTIYARTTGNDTTGNGRTPATAYRTFQRAVRDVPSIVPAGVSYVVDITGLGIETLPVNYQLPVVEGTFFGGTNAPHPFLFNHVLSVRAFPQLVTAIPPADAVITTADAPVLTSNADTKLAILTLGIARASWAGGALKGKQFVRTLGTSQTSCCIYDSNATQLFLCNKIGPGPNFIPPLAPGEQFQIVEPSATLEAPPSTDFDGGAIRCMNVSSVAFQGIRLRCSVPGGDFSLFIAGASQPFFELCDIPDGVETGDAQYQLSMFSTFMQGSNGVLVDSDTFALRRSYFANITDFSFSTRHQDMNLSVIENCAELRNKVAAPGFVPSPNVMTTWSLFDMLITGSTGDGLHAQGGAWGLTNVRIDNSAGNGINVEHGTNYVKLDHVTGAGNAGVGVLANDGAQVQITDTTTPTTTLTGTGGDVKSGSLAVAAYAAGMNQYDIPPNSAIAVSTGTRIFERA
jgi:hypothetical protein